MRFTQPWLLLAIPLAWLFVWLVATRGMRSVSPRQHRWAIVSRLLVVALLGLSLGNPLIVSAVDTTSVYFLVDRSTSISEQARQAQDDYINQALEEPLGATGVLVFGADSRVDTPLGERSNVAISTTVDGSGTDLASALRAAASLLPTEGSRRVVVLSDGVPTQGDARTAARELAESGIVIDVVQVVSARGSDAIVEQVVLPTSAREGDEVPVTVRIRSNASMSAELTVSASSTSPITLPVELTPGMNEFTVLVPADSSGVLQVSASLSGDSDTRQENNKAEGLTRVLGQANIVIVEGRTGEAQELERALDAGGLSVDVVTAIPSPAELLRYDALVLVNVPAPDRQTAESIATYVEDFGRGLVVIGGDQSYGMGGYGGSALESVLPVQSSPEDLVRRQPVAEVFVIDTSGSMGACHCGSGGGSAEGGVNKTDISRAGANLAINALEDTDLVGVVAVSSGTDWVLPLGVKPSEADTAEALGGLHAEGDTEIANGLQAALDELRGVDGALRHIVLFTDGWDPNDNGLLPIAREIADEGITLSVLGTGEGPGTNLQRMAAVGGGRYYPGADLTSIPEIFVEETLTVSKNLVEEGVFVPVLGAASRVTDSLSASPALLGYVLTKPKGTASVPLLIGQDDPLLATWQRGLGRSTAWTSDATARWSSAWVTWDGYVDFWGAVVRDVLPAGLDNPPEVVIDEGELSIAYVAGEVPLDATATARVRLPDGETATVPLQRTSSTTFEASTSAGAPGAYWVSVAVEAGGALLSSSSSGTLSSYQEEFAFRDPDPTLAADVADITGGRVDPQPESVFDRAPRAGNAETPIWMWLTAMAMLLFLVDIALRRLVFAPGDREVWKAAVRSPRVAAAHPIVLDDEGKPLPPPPPKDAGTAGHLLKRKNR